ncbi:MAG: hypothetical protein KIS96_01270 [Bauldia sp.]|nr:hypothetical protein [Bauldia sp.]
MSARFVAGAAGIALMVAAASVARAADAPLPGAETATATSTEPKVSVVLEAGIEGSVILGSPPPAFSLYSYGEVDVKFASGFGITLSERSSVLLSTPLLAFVDVNGRLYKSLGLFEIGIHGHVGVSVPFGAPVSSSFGPDIRYETDRLTVTNSTYFTFFGGVFSGWGNGTEITFDVTDRVEIHGFFGVDFDGGGPSVTVLAEATIKAGSRLEVVPSIDVVFSGMGTFLNTGVILRVPLGVVTPYVGANWSPGNFANVELGIDLERQIGTGPLSLIGNAEYSVGFFGGPPLHRVSGQIGLRYTGGSD